MWRKLTQVQVEYNDILSLEITTQRKKVYNVKKKEKLVLREKARNIQIHLQSKRYLV
jgi:hypothetical protein